MSERGAKARVNHPGSEAGKDIAKLALDCLRRTIVLVWCSVHYPPGNRAIADAAAAWKASMGEMLARRDSFLLALMRNRLYFEDTRLEARDEMSLHFIRELANRRIRKIVFLRGATPSDLEKFSRVMSGTAADLLRQGGARHLLARLGVRSVEVVEGFYQAPGEEGEPGEYWEAKLRSLGLEKDEILPFLLGRGRLPRLLTDELRLLAEAMKDPVFLSQILAHLAAEEAPDGRPHPGEVFRLAKRFHYILIANALFDPKETPRMLRRGMQALEPDLRLRLLAEKVRCDGEGRGYVEEDLFGFTPEEYAQWLLSEFERKGSWRAPAAPLRAGAERAGELAKAFRAALMTSPAWEDEGSVEEEAAALARGLAAPPSLARTPAAEPPSPLGAPRGHFAAAVEAAAQRCSEDIERGYANALLHMLAKAQWSANEVLDRLLEVVEDRVALGRCAEAIETLADALPPDLEPGRRVSLRNRIQAKLAGPARERLMQSVAQGLFEGDPSAPGEARLLAAIFGPAFLDRVADDLFADRTAAPSPPVLEFAAGFERQFAPLLFQKAQSADPLDRIRAVEILSAFDSADAHGAVLSALHDQDPSVRLVALLSMGRGTNALGIAQLMEIAGRRGGGETAAAERCAAVVSLGRLGHAPAIGLIEEALARKTWRRTPASQRLKMCAAKALKDIGRPESLAILRKHLAQSG